MYIDTKKTINKMYENIDLKIKQLKEEGAEPSIAIIRVDGDAASKVYVESKEKRCEEHGINSTIVTLPNDTTMKALISQIEFFNKSSIDGFMLQLPLPKHLNPEVAIKHIDPRKDIDCLTTERLGQVFKGEMNITPCTPKGILKILEDNVELEGKDVLIINRSMLVGIPLARMLTNKNATVTIAHSKTLNLENKMMNADIIITAVGQANFIQHRILSILELRAKYTCKDKYIIDVSMNRNEQGKLCGDVIRDEEFINSLANVHITPVPGGVGLTTVASLLDNTLEIIVEE